MNEQVMELQRKIIECQEETLRLLHQNPCLRDKYQIAEQAKQRATAALTRQVGCNSTLPSKFEKELEALGKSLKLTEQKESELKERFETSKVLYAEYKKKYEPKVTETERRVDELESITNKAANDKLHKTRLEMEKRLENLDVFCKAVYSTLKSKECSSVSIVKEAQLDHPFILVEKNCEKCKGSMKSQ